MLTPQAITLLVTYGLLSAAVVALSIKARSAVSGVVGMITWVVYVTLIVYDTNCLVRGGCSIWSWVRTVLYIVMPIVLFTLAAVALYRDGDKGDARERRHDEGRPDGRMHEHEHEHDDD